MKNADKPISPIVDKYGVVSDKNAISTGTLSGLTKREHFAAMAMQGILSNAEILGQIAEITESHNLLSTLARMSTDHADALLAELEKQP